MRPISAPVMSPNPLWRVCSNTVPSVTVPRGPMCSELATSTIPSSAARVKVVEGL